MTKYREHRGSLVESMETVREVADRNALVEMITKDLHPWRRAMDLSDIASTLKVEPYGYESRIGWNTHIVTLPNYGVLGMTDGPL